ncbi:hypothetical protein HYDPIDRAFT_25360 [Hydnomerulius pinastri MD-312]|nr:hypothetical protein HYDPIDRAFT_25360 [Hydnomerulius pinastri MD-312]
MSLATVVSAPGKVLLAGGYLVLDRKYKGLAISASSRFYAVVQDGQGLTQGNQILVRSPQFIEAEWRYTVTVSDDGKVDVSEASESKNKFVHYALKYALILAMEKLTTEGSSNTFHDILKHGLDIATVGDNDFYSQQAKLKEMGLPSTVASLSQIPPFCPQNVKLDQVNKTGMGSSAALITSIVSALLLRFKVITEDEFSERSSKGGIKARLLAHNTAQFVHCLAQGKVGSGFDVSAAVYGSQLYTRFDPVMLDKLMKGGDAVSGPLKLMPTLTESWDCAAEPFQLPPLVRLVLADVHGGSNTPSLIRTVLNWRKTKVKEADELWTKIDTSNNKLVQHLQDLCKLHQKHSDAYQSEVQRMSSLPRLEWLTSTSLKDERKTIVETFHNVYETGENTRAFMRAMGEQAGDNAPIEPEEQTNLLDQCISQNGVICGGVPGAGGYDAIWLLVLDPRGDMYEPLHAVERVWERFPNVSPLLATESQDQGAKVEKLEEVPGLSAAVQLRR